LVSPLRAGFFMPSEIARMSKRRRLREERLALLLAKAEFREVCGRLDQQQRMIREQLGLDPERPKVH